MSPEPSLVCLSMELVATSGSNIPWTTGDIALLREHAHFGAAEVARLLERTIWSVRQQAYRQRISLRQHGCRRGVVLGQPRGVSLRRELRDDLVRDRRDELLAQRAKVDAEAALCPCCGRRPVRTRSGFCRACHLDRMTELYEEMTADDCAMQRSWAARQRRKGLLDGMDAS